MTRRINIDDADLRRRAFRIKRHGAVRIPCRILIVCEGEKTEPGYFKFFNGKDNGKFIPKISFDGGKINTLNVVKKAIRLCEKAQSSLPYDSAWAVFDKDDFTDRNFNAAIQLAHSHHINCAWSNEAFELWYLLHFTDVRTAMSRRQYEVKISHYVNNSPSYKLKRTYVYSKNAPDNYEIMTKYGEQEKAEVRAEQLYKSYDHKDYAKQNPCTTVYRLVRQLKGCDETFNHTVSQMV